MENNKTTKSTEQAVINRIGFDNLLEDIFGLNIRALKTIWALFKMPVKYFKAAKTPDWIDSYTPSFRVWFGLMALFVGLKFLYATETNIMIDAFTGMMEQIKTSINSSNPDKPANFDTTLAAQEFLKWMTVYFPFAYIPVIALLAIVYRAWTEHLSYVTRLRFLFGTVIPSTVMIILVTLSTVFIKAKIFMAISAITVFLMVFLDFITAYRGPYGHVKSGGERVGRSLVLTAVLFIVYYIASFIAMIPAFIMVFKKLL